MSKGWYVKKGPPPDRFAAKKAAVVEAYKRGDRVKDIAAAFETDVKSVRNWIRAAGIPSRYGRVKASVIELAEKGMSAKEIEFLTRCTRQYIYDLNRDLGLGLTL